GCGIACAAMVLRVSYRGAKRLIFGNVDWRPHFGTTTKNLANALRQRGLAVRDRLIPCRGKWPDLPKLCIVKVRPPGCRRKEWHWVLYGRGEDGWRVLDPSRPNSWRRPPWPPISYLEIPLTPIRRRRKLMQ